MTLMTRSDKLSDTENICKNTKKNDRNECFELQKKIVEMATHLLSLVTLDAIYFISNQQNNGK